MSYSFDFNLNIIYLYQKPHSLWLCRILFSISFYLLTSLLMRTSCYRSSLASRWSSFSTVSPSLYSTTKLIHCTFNCVSVQNKVNYLHHSTDVLIYTFLSRMHIESMKQLVFFRYITCSSCSHSNRNYPKCNHSINQKKNQIHQRNHKHMIYTSKIVPKLYEARNYQPSLIRNRMERQ